jgi:catechol 2,3-dioxygenase-like lactoylglutathione lyase family enzyme
MFEHLDLLGSSRKAGGPVTTCYCDGAGHTKRMDASLAERIFGPLAKPLHLGISVANLETSIEWYSKYLGFTLSKKVDLQENLRIAILEYQGFGVELIELQGSQQNVLAGKEILAQHNTQGIVHFAFEVANVDATATVLRETGATFACEPTSLPELGVRYFHIYDCDGNLLEFGQRI